MANDNLKPAQKVTHGTDSPASDGYVFTEADLDACWPAYKYYLLEILNGEYKVDAAKDDLLSLVGSKYDRRINT